MAQGGPKRLTGAERKSRTNFGAESGSCSYEGWRSGCPVCHDNGVPLTAFTPRIERKGTFLSPTEFLLANPSTQSIGDWQL
jgi:hypothetical protein